MVKYASIKVKPETASRLKDYCSAWNLTRDEMLRVFMDSKEEQFKVLIENKIKVLIENKIKGADR